MSIAEACENAEWVVDSLATGADQLDTRIHSAMSSFDTALESVQNDDDFPSKLLSEMKGLRERVVIPPSTEEGGDARYLPLGDEDAVDIATDMVAIAFAIWRVGISTGASGWWSA
jgi:hypothetical protein